MNSQYLAIIRNEVANDSSRRLFMLPQVSQPEIQLVTDSLVCARAQRAMGGKIVPHYVFRIGSSFAVIDENTGVDADGIYYFGPDWGFISSVFVQ